MQDLGQNIPRWSQNQAQMRKGVRRGWWNIYRIFGNLFYFSPWVWRTPLIWPDLFGWYFERLAGVLEHPDVPFYGRYIDDCLAVVYAESEAQAISLISGLIKFDNCVITWEASGSHAPFLDMMLYKDADRSLQHMPYRKAGNSQERIPWISAHPYDVKRGTFLGEMSRLATLSSKVEHYSAAMRGLVTLYIHRGYP